MSVEIQAALENHHSENGSFHSCNSTNFTSVTQRLFPAKHKPGKRAFSLQVTRKEQCSQNQKKMIGNERYYFPLSHSNPLASSSLFQISARALSLSDSQSLTRLLKITSQLQDMHIISGKHFCKLSNSSTAQAD